MRDKELSHQKKIASKRRNIILVANPCHVTPPEHGFWQQAAAEAKRRGWHWLELATRALPETELVESISLPARLSDVFARLPPLATSTREVVPAWMSHDYLRVLEDWEYRRWSVDERLPATLLGLLRLTNFVDDAIDLAQPSVVLTTNKIDHGVTLYREASLHRGLTTKVVERSPLDSIWLEPNGLFGESISGSVYDPATCRKAPELIEAGKTYISKVVANPHGFRAATGPVKLPRWFENLKRPIFLLPMDNVLWTGWEQIDHPMRNIDNPLYPSPREAMEDLLAHTQALGGSLVIKRHPACLAITEKSLPKGAHWIEGDLDALLSAADVVLTFNTKVAFPALALGRPVVTLAPNPVAACGATYHCLDRNRVRPTLQAALASKDLDAKLQCFPPFIGWLAKDFFYDCQEDPNPGHRGPKNFVADLISDAGEIDERLDDDQFLALAQDLRKLAAAPIKKQPPAKPAKTVEPAKKAPSSGNPENSALQKPKTASTASRSLPSKALRTLRREGFGELTRKTILWLLPRLGKKTLRIGTSILEKVGVKTDELKAKLPYLVQYRRKWIPARALPYAATFQRLWRSPLAKDSTLLPSGGSRREMKRLESLRGRFQGKPAAIFAPSRFSEKAEILSGPKPPLIFAVEEPALVSGDREPDFFTTTEPSQALAINKLLSANQQTLFFLPQSLGGLVEEHPRLFWFGQGCSGRDPAGSPVPLIDIPRKGLGGDGSAVENAALLAEYLGCKVLSSEALSKAPVSPSPPGVS